MATKGNIDIILKKWPFDPENLGVRTVKGRDNRELLQMRIDMGILQLEIDGRPDGTRPEGFETYLDYLDSQVLKDDDAVNLDDEICCEIDREFVQFYHRRICWLTLRQFDRAVQDADHTLALMDFCRSHSSDEQWTMSHEQYRPFVLFHRTQAMALAALEASGPEDAIENLNKGLAQFRDFFAEYEADEHFDEDDLVTRLVDLRESLREQFDVGQTLEERLAAAVAREEYELAAELRDELARRTEVKH